MRRIIRKAEKVLQRIIDRAMGGGLMQEGTAAQGERYVTPGISDVIRLSGAEGCVLLENDGVLPLSLPESIAVFGRCQLDWFYVGYGSGGDVHPPYKVNLIDGLDNAGARYDKILADIYRRWTSDERYKADNGWWGHWPRNYPEMPLDERLVKGASERSKTAVVVIGRAAGEDRENVLEKGSYYLTDGERDMLDLVTGQFEHTVVILNIGNIIDMGWIKEYGGRLSSVLIAWQGGMESGNAVCDVLYGKVSPCGKLPDTISVEYADYPSAANFGGRRFNEYAEGIFVGYRYFDSKAPDKILYPFGYGLSYTSFQVEPVKFSRTSGISVTVDVRNTGAFPGKEVVQLFVSQPEGRLEKPKRVLAAFCKTRELAPGESERVTLGCGDKYLASYDEGLHAFILEAGRYAFTANGVDVGEFCLEDQEIVEMCERVCSPEVDLRSRILDRMPEAYSSTSEKQVSFEDVMDGRAELREFIAQLSTRELEALTRGHGMMGSPLGTPGNAGTFGGVIPSLREKGVPPITCCDGPAGIRLQRYCSLLPCGTGLAATWNTDIVSKLYGLVGTEMRHYGVDILLAPGMNIHRNPLCGRNFEYFSEDPVLTGKMAAAVVRGIESRGVGSCPKHFACNNQETNRNRNDSRVSERALREIYLRGFEICVKEARPISIMTSYNKINGVWSHYNYDLATTILRREWGYDGMVMTDWWMRRARCPEFPKLRDNAYRVRAQVDVLMPGDTSHIAKRYRSDGTLLGTLGERDGLTLGELHRTAHNVLRLIIRMNCQIRDSIRYDD